MPDEQNGKKRRYNKEYYQKYWSRPEVKQRHNEYMKQYYKTEKGKQIRRNYFHIYYHNNIDYITLIRFIQSRKAKLEKRKFTFGRAYQEPYSRQQSKLVAQSLEEEIVLYQEYLDRYKEFRKTLAGIKDEQIKSELKEKFLIDLAKEIGKNHSTEDILKV